MIKKLGEGASGETKLAEKDGSLYALKLFDMRNPEKKETKKLRELAKHEVSIASTLKHKHIVKHHEFKESETLINKDGKEQPAAFIAQEAVLGGDLASNIIDTGAFDEDFCRYYFKQILSALYYMHS